jgi:hypothetical protein
MRPRAIWDISYYLARAVQWLFGVCGAVLPISEKISIEDIRKNLPFLVGPVGWAQGNTWWATPVSLLLAGVAAFAMKWIGEPWAWQMATSLLNGFRNQLFKGKKDPVHHHRVTLFKIQHWCFCWKYKRVLFRAPWQRWLRALLRSGHTTLRSKPTFAIPDDAENVEGIAGLAWSKRATIYETNLPQLSTASNQTNLRKYAEKTKMDSRELELRVKDGKSFARSYCAFPIESESGDIWGVMVIDSQGPDLPDENEITAIFFPVAKCLTKLVSRL